PLPEGAVMRLGTVRFRQRALNLLKFSPDGKTLIGIVSQDGLKRWNVAAGKELPELTGEDQTFTDFAYVPDGKIRVVGTTNNVFRFLDPANGRQLLEDKDLPFMPTISGFGGMLRITPDGKSMAVLEEGEKNGAHVVLVDLASGAARGRTEGDFLRELV